MIFAQCSLSLKTHSLAPLVEQMEQREIKAFNKSEERLDEFIEAGNSVRESKKK